VDIVPAISEEQIQKNADPVTRLYSQFVQHPRRSAMRRIARTVIAGALVGGMLVLAPGLGRAQEREFAGQQTVGEFRADARSFGEKYSVGFASGVVGFMNIVMWCDTPGTVGDLHAYLLHGADPRATIWQALAVAADRRGCEFKSIEEMRKTLRIEGRR
jgi:hypothetical protein